jgi:hypothetical protein
VRVDGERDVRIRVPERLADGHYVDTSRQQIAREGVPLIMEPDLPQPCRAQRKSVARAVWKGGVNAPMMSDNSSNPAKRVSSWLVVGSPSIH